MHTPIKIIIIIIVPGPVCLIHVLTILQRFIVNLALEFTDNIRDLDLSGPVPSHSTVTLPLIESYSYCWSVK